jgi:acyl-CoA thioesterase
MSEPAGRVALLPDGMNGPRDANPFADFLGLRWDGLEVRLTIRPELVNGTGRLLGPVAFALVDYGMSAALWDELAEHEICATINLAINFVDSADSGEVVCTSSVDRRTRRVAATSAQLRHADGRLLATAIGSFAIMPARSGPSPPG